ncbi:MAG: hypothetical protein HYS13_13965 [Planctomycetia bacterium]|nr:hypothetical protein [Planctomycetia bacterium]
MYAIKQIGATVLAVLASASLSAQQQPRGATTVQLPTFSFFTVSTTVMVPDGGGMHMGGIRRASDGYTKFRTPFLPGARTAGSERSTAGMYVRAYVHDFDAMERELSTASRRGEPEEVVVVVRPPEEPDHPLAKQLAAARQDENAGALRSVAEIRRQKEAEKQNEDAEVLALVERGDEALAAGNISDARVFFTLASRKADAALKPQIAKRLAELPEKPSKKPAPPK